MPTLAGGGTLPTIGLTSSENEFITSVLNTSSSGQTIAVQQVAPVASIVQGAAEVLIGNIRTTNVSNSVVAATGGTGDVVQVTVPTGGSGSVTNLVIDNSIQNIVLSGTSENQISTVFAGSNTSLVVADAGSNFLILDSNSTVGATIVSGVGNDSIIGGGGNDQVRLGDAGIANGGGGADTLIGGTGFATLGGGGGADSIVAASGGGVMIGEAGNDTLTAGAGNDIIIFQPGDGSDRVVGFDPTKDTLAFASVNYGAGGTLDLSSLISNATVSGGNTVLTLPDGSTITVVGVTGININWFTVK